jgi:hypothetical protein
MDLAVVSAIYESGAGILAKEIIPLLKQYKLEKHKILRIVNRANGKCTEAFGRTLIEKRGKKWAFTDFGFEIWGKTKRDFEEESEAADKSNISHRNVDNDGGES